MQDAVWRLRMVGEDLGDGAWLALFKRLDFFKERNEGLRVVSGAIHILHAQVVRLRFKFAREVHERDWNTDRGGFVDSVTSPAANKDERDSTELRVVHAGHLPYCVMRANVGDLMRHYARKFSFLVCVQNEA